MRKKAEHNEGEISTLEELSLHQQDIERFVNRSGVQFEGDLGKIVALYWSQGEVGVSLKKKKWTPDLTHLHNTLANP